MSHPFTPAKRPPRLTEAVLKNDSAVSLAIDVLFAIDQDVKKLSRRILRAQRRLRRRVSNEQFKFYMAIEEHENDRAQAMLATVARWAFSQGQRSRGT